MTHTMSLPVPVGSLETYIQAVNRFPILSLEEERNLARKFRSENDVEAARQLVLSHLRVVVAIARGYMGYGLPQGDLIQEGNIGLMKAVKRFDPERGVRLVSFAVHWIRQATRTSRMRRSPTWPTARRSPRRSSRRSKTKLCGRTAWRQHWRVSMRAAAASSKRAGCEKRTRRPCTSLPQSSRFLPSA